jgi:hypothetical protein
MCRQVRVKVRHLILAVEVQEIKGKEHDPVRRLVDGRAQGLEIGSPILVLDNDLAIEDGRRAGQLGAGLDHPAVGSGPVTTMPGEGSDLALVDEDEGAIAIVLDLMNPAAPCRGF